MSRDVFSSKIHSSFSQAPSLVTLRMKNPFKDMLHIMLIIALKNIISLPFLYFLLCHFLWIEYSFSHISLRFIYMLCLYLTTKSLRSLSSSPDPPDIISPSFEFLWLFMYFGKTHHIFLCRVFIGVNVIQIPHFSFYIIMSITNS